MGKSTSSYKPQKRADGRWAIRLMVDGESVYIYGKTQSEVRDRLKTKLKEIEDATMERHRLRRRHNPYQ